ncbi:MBL fold metallo-hydrolase [Halosegnis marinus]|uniref:MBL fold metallo-hydrolase n=1 Tax=Halosegnis marinus TaxID=3034023 RepID=A0ABD5ZTA0_9EURY|nr:MBL fold metallo-hydrolase [Halosegnis sp. DT85]
MRVTFLGTGSAMPTGDRNQTGLLLDAGDDTLLVDCGSGVLGALAGTVTGYEAVDTVLLTHHHLDHVSDLLALLKARWLAGEEHLTVVGPEGTESLLDGLLGVHEYLQGRVDLSVREVAAGSFSVAGFDVEAAETVHSMDCLAYRFSHADADGDFCFSGDSEATEPVAALADGAAVLAHDCSFPDEVDVSNHPTPRALGEVLAGRDIGELYLTHLYPHTDGKHVEMTESIRANFEGDVRVADDGLTVEV